MLERYNRRSVDDHINALREILQEIFLCGLWRAKFVGVAGADSPALVMMDAGIRLPIERRRCGLAAPSGHLSQVARASAARAGVGGSAAVARGYSTVMACSSTGTTYTVALVKSIVKVPVTAGVNVLRTR